MARLLHCAALLFVVAMAATTARASDFWDDDPVVPEKPINGGGEVNGPKPVPDFDFGDDENEVPETGSGSGDAEEPESPAEPESPGADDKEKPADGSGSPSKSEDGGSPGQPSGDDEEPADKGRGSGDEDTEDSEDGAVEPANPQGGDEKPKAPLNPEVAKFMPNRAKPSDPLVTLDDVNKEIAADEAKIAAARKKKQELIAEDNDAKRERVVEEVSDDMVPIYNVLARTLGLGENFAKIDDEMTTPSTVIGKFTPQIIFRAPEAPKAPVIASADGDDAAPVEPVKPAVRDDGSAKAKDVALTIEDLYQRNAIGISRASYGVTCDDETKVTSQSADLAFKLGAQFGIEAFGIQAGMAAGFKKGKHSEDSQVLAESSCSVNMLSASLQTAIAKKFVTVNPEAHRAWMALPILSSVGTECSDYQRWFEWFAFYGTHFINGVDLGGAIKVSGIIDDSAVSKETIANIQSAFNASLRKILQAAIAGANFDPASLAKMPLDQLAATNDNLRTLLGKLDQDLKIHANINTGGLDARSLQSNLVNVKYTITGGDPKKNPVVNGENSAAYIDAQKFLVWQSTLLTHADAVRYRYGEMSDLHEDDPESPRAQSYRMAFATYKKLAKQYAHMNYVSTMMMGRVEGFKHIIDSNVDLVKGDFKKIKDHDQKRLWMTYKVLMDECDALENLTTQKSPLLEIFDIHMRPGSVGATDCKKKLVGIRQIMSLGDKANFETKFGRDVITTMSARSASQRQGIVTRSTDGDKVGELEKHKEHWNLFSSWHTRYVEISKYGVTYWEDMGRKTTTQVFIPYHVMMGVIIGLPADLVQKNEQVATGPSGFQIVTQDRSYIFRVEGELDSWLFRLSEFADQFLLRCTEAPAPPDTQTAKVSQQDGVMVTKTGTAMNKITIKDLLANAAPFCTQTSALKKAMAGGAQPGAGVRADPGTRMLSFKSELLEL